MDLRQFKLVSDEEILCDVVQWNDDDHDTIVIRHALKIVADEDLESQLRYYTFKPWMSMSVDLDQLIVLNSFQIVAESKPSNAAIEYYSEIIGELKDLSSNEYVKLSSLLDSDTSNVISDPISKQIH